MQPLQQKGASKKIGTEFWTDHVAAAKRETISASEYARCHGISVAGLYYWQRKLKIATTSTAKKVSMLAEPAHASSFVALRVLDKQVIPPRQCTLVLLSDLRLKMSVLPEPSWLAALGYAMHEQILARRRMFSASTESAGRECSACRSVRRCSIAGTGQGSNTHTRQTQPVTSRT